jgi:hypothetical protein
MPTGLEIDARVTVRKGRDTGMSNGGLHRFSSSYNLHSKATVTCVTIL